MGAHERQTVVSIFSPAIFLSNWIWLGLHEQGAAGVHAAQRFGIRKPIA